jgi:hypothetical protein
MLALVEDPAQTLLPPHIQTRDLARVNDRRGQRSGRPTATRVTGTLFFVSTADFLEDRPTEPTEPAAATAVLGHTPA